LVWHTVRLSPQQVVELKESLEFIRDQTESRKEVAMTRRILATLPGKKEMANIRSHWQFPFTIDEAKFLTEVSDVFGLEFPRYEGRRKK